MARSVLLGAGSLLALIASPAFAQTAATTTPTAATSSTTAPTTTAAAPEQQDGVSDIIVTAQRRSENVQNVPISITALGQQQLEERGISNALQIAQFVPNLTAMNNTGLGSANAYYLRGLGSTETIPTYDPPVGTYVDEVYLSRQNANNLSLFDVERVEVLRGPQGTLFGRNTTGGAISVIMAQPKDVLGGYAEVGYGRWNKVLARGSIDVPLAPGFSAKVSGYYQNDDGYVKNVTTGQRLNDDDGWGVRLGLRGDLSPSVKWQGSYAHIVADGENILNFVCNPLNLAQCNGRYSSTGLSKVPGTFAGLNIHGRKANYGLGVRNDSDLITSKFDIGVGSLGTLSLITGFVNQVQQYGLDFFDGRSSNAPSIANAYPTPLQLPKGGFTFLADQQSNQFSQEVKLSGSAGSGLIDYVGGVFYIHENVSDDFADILGTTTATGAAVLGDRILRNSTNAVAGYFQADVNVGILKFTAGIRYTDEIKRLDFHDNRAICAVAPLPVSCLDTANLIVPANGTTVLTAQAIPTKLETKIWTPRFAINAKPSDNLLLFVSATRGFKSGGWNARETSPVRILPFGPEKVWSYEAGFKATLLDRIARLNVSVFQLDVKDLQTPSAFVNASGSLSFITRNFADYRNRGVEAELTLAPAHGLNLFANLGYSRDHYVLKTGQPAFDQYGIQSVATQLANCKLALAAGKVPGGANLPATNPPISSCASGIVTAQGTIAEPVRTPDWTFSLGGSYRAEMSGGWAITPSVAASYSSQMEVGTSNITIFSGAITGTNGTFPNNLNSGTTIFGSRSAAHWLVNGGIALSAPGNAIKLSVECTNCFNTTFVQSSLGNYTYLNPPMSWLVKARYNF